MQAINEMKEPLEIINALQKIMDSQINLPDLNLEIISSYSALPHTSTTFHEQSDIHAIITDRRLQLETLSHDLSVLEPVMKKIKTFHQKLVNNKKSLAYSLALERLPNEILARIFVFCLPENIEELSPLYPALAPMLLTHVCQRWRRVAVNMPSLWCTMCITPDLADYYVRETPYVTWLQRTRGSSLTLCITSEYETESQDLYLIDFLSPYMKQVSSLHLFNTAFATELLQDTPSLQELILPIIIYSKEVEPFTQALLHQSKFYLAQA